MAGLGGGFGGILGNGMLQQIFLYNAVGSILGTALQPLNQGIANAIWSDSPNVPLSPSELALAVVRGELSEADAAGEAKQSGINPERFHTLYRITGSAPAPGDLAVALRRKIIDDARFTKGIQQSMLRDEWEDVVKALSVSLPSPTLALQAYLEGQTDEATARDLWRLFGGAPEYFEIAYNTEGQAPTPVQALDLANRGIIPWKGRGAGVVSYEQAFLEGPWRNKWLESFIALGAYLPPPRTIVAMLREGSLDQATGLDLLRKQGLTEQLAQAYVQSAVSQKTQTTKDLGEATVKALYRDQIIDRATAGGLLETLGYDAKEADFVLQVVDLEIAQKYLNALVSRIHTLYVGHKIPKNVALTTLSQGGIPNDQAVGLVDLWGYERAANVKTLTPAQVATAFKDGIITQGDAQADLEAQGYLPFDAWLFLSQHLHKELPNKPPAGQTALGLE